MEKQFELNKVLLSIKTNNLNLFGLYAKKYMHVSFGRFSLPALCYMYNAKKIIRKYQEDFLKIKNYKVEPEPIDVYLDFKKLAGKNLRLYYSNDNIITFIEILALSNKDRLVEKYYRYFTNNINVKENLEKIYNRNGQKITFYLYKVEIEKPILDHSDILVCKKNLFVYCGILVVFGIMFLLSTFLVGFGLEKIPNIISTEGQLYSALKNSGNYKIASDIRLSKIPSDIVLNSNIDFCGHTLYIDTLSHNYIIKENNGSIVNLNIMYNCDSLCISSDLSFFVLDNNGTIENVNVLIGTIKLICNSENQSVGISGIADTNKGKISNCNVDIKATASSAGGSDYLISGIAKVNSGNINNCSLKSGSSITTTNVDIAGIVGTNDYLAEISNCDNFAKLSQNSTLATWSPNTSGIAIFNYGQINDCSNYGEISSISEMTSNYQVYVYCSGISIINYNKINRSHNFGLLYGSSESIAIYLGGIVSINYNEIKKCLNNADIITESNTAISYVGGIVGYSSYKQNSINSEYSIVSNCGINGNINTSSSGENGYVFVGGICGSGQLNIDSCYSNATFEYGSEEKYFVGYVVGLATFSVVVDYNGQSYNQVYLMLNNTYVLENENPTKVIGALINNNNIYKGISSIENIEICNSYETLKEKEVYWNV